MRPTAVIIAAFIACAAGVVHGSDEPEPRFGQVRAPPARIQPLPAPPERGVRSTIEQRQSQPQVPVQGPASVRQPDVDAASAAQAQQPPAKVYDAKGRLLPGAVQVGPDRIFDPGTGRYRRVLQRGNSLHVIDGG